MSVPYDRYRAAFSKRHALLLSIYVSTDELAQRNACIAHDEGADGVFLTNHGGMEALHRLAADLHARFPSLWIGVNCRGQQPEEAFTVPLPPEVNGVWTDSAAVYSYMEGKQLHARRVAAARTKSGSEALYFGTVVSKDHPTIDTSDLGIVAREATEYVDVITMGGDTEHLPPSLKQVRSVRSMCGIQHPLALAGGIRTENVRLFTGAADCFIVASSVCLTPPVFDAALVRALVQTIART